VGFAVALLLPEKSIDFQTLNGRWLRPDGGYVLEIRAVDPSGSIDARISIPTRSTSPKPKPRVMVRR
jgi:hypothetical protein